MKRINKYFLLPTCSLLVMMLAVSCLKDEAYEDGKINIVTNKDDKILEVRGPIVGAYSQVLNFSTGDTSIPLVTINLASVEPAQEDIKVTLGVDQGVISEYNTRVKEDFTLLPAARYNFQTFEVTIPKGSREAVLTGKILNPSFLQTGKYALGVKILSVSNPGYKISGNYGKQVIALRVKNKYHGLYHATGVFTHPVAGPRNIDEDKELTTEEPNSVLANLGDLGAAGYQMVLVVNADNSVTILPRGATPNIDQKWGPSYYDPATKAFHLHYSYNIAAPRIVQEVIKLK